MVEQQQAQHDASSILAIGDVSYVEVPTVGKKYKMMEKINSVTAAKTTAETTTTTMDMMNSFIRRQQAQHEATRKFALGVVSDVEVPGVLLNDKVNNFEVPGVVLKKNNVGRNKKTCGVKLPEAARKFAFDVVSGVEVPSVFLNDKMNNVDVPVVVLKKKTVGRKKNIFDVELPGVGLKNKIYGVEVPSVGMSNNM